MSNAVEETEVKDEVKQIEKPVEEKIEVNQIEPVDKTPVVIGENPFRLIHLDNGVGTRVDGIPLPNRGVVLRIDGKLCFVPGAGMRELQRGLWQLC